MSRGLQLKIWLLTIQKDLCVPLSTPTGTFRSLAAKIQWFVCRYFAFSGAQGASTSVHRVVYEASPVHCGWLPRGPVLPLRHDAVTIFQLRFHWQKDLQQHRLNSNTLTGIIFCLRPANERQRYIVTSSLIGWAHIQWSLLWYRDQGHATLPGHSLDSRAFAAETWTRRCGLLDRCKWRWLRVISCKNGITKMVPRQLGIEAEIPSKYVRILFINVFKSALTIGAKSQRDVALILALKYIYIYRPSMCVYNIFYLCSTLAAHTNIYLIIWTIARLRPAWRYMLNCVLLWIIFCYVILRMLVITRGSFYLNSLPRSLGLSVCYG